MPARPPITDGTDLISPAHYGEHGAPHETWTRLRRESPVHWCEPEGFDPFWAITKHADICSVSKQPDLFLNGPGIVVATEDQKRIRASGQGLSAMRVIIEMDPPEHRSYRKLASPMFTPRALGRLDAAIDESARSLVDALVAKAADDGTGDCEFAAEIAAAHPLRILSTILGIPRNEEAKVLELTNQLFGSDDPDLRRPGDDQIAAITELGMELYQFFAAIIEDRRQSPRDDLASLLANGQVDGQPMGPMETFGYYLITFTAGHDTTKNALVGGMRALAEHPDQFEQLRARPELVPNAVEEIVRWTSPVNYMKRTAARDTEVRGQKIREGEELALFYCSANRDEDAFEAPFEFRIDRDPNPHLGFGIGEHFCLGANLARRSQAALWRELTRRIDSVEIVGEPRQIHSNFVVGLKSLPIRYRLA